MLIALPFCRVAEFRSKNIIMGGWKLDLCEKQKRNRTYTEEIIKYVTCRQQLHFLDSTKQVFSAKRWRFCSS